MVRRLNWRTEVAPRLFPSGTDRSWTRTFYYAVNRIFRKHWHDSMMDQKLGRAVSHSVLHHWPHGSVYIINLDSDPPPHIESIDV